MEAAVAFLKRAAVAQRNFRGMNHVPETAKVAVCYFKLAAIVVLNHPLNMLDVLFAGIAAFLQLRKTVVGSQPFQQVKMIERIHWAEIFGVIF